MGWAALKTANQKRADKLAQAAYSGALLIAKQTPTPYDDAALKGLGSARKALRKLANWLRKRGYVLAVILLPVVGAVGCSTIVRADAWLLEWVPCDPIEQPTTEATNGCTDATRTN